MLPINGGVSASLPKVWFWMLKEKTSQCGLYCWVLACLMKLSWASAASRMNTTWAPACCSSMTCWV